MTICHTASRSSARCGPNSRTSCGSCAGDGAASGFGYHSRVFTGAGSAPFRAAGADTVGAWRSLVAHLHGVDASLNPELIGKTPLQVLDLWMAEADRQGMYVLLDFHSVSMVRQYPTWFVSNPADFGLVYNQQAYTKENWTRDLAFVAKRYAGLAHFFAIDIYNEPNGIVRWSAGDANSPDPVYFWKDAAELASAAVLAANPSLLIFVQGINGNFDGRENSGISMNWGEDFQPQAYQPLQIPADKLVLTPHTYGPDVYVKASFSAANFPANLAADWDVLFGQFHPTHPVVVGEWGGKYGTGTGGTKDVTWQDAFVDYLKAKGIGDSFFWCYTPNSGDTGGILDDSLTVRQDKLVLLQKLWGSEVAARSPPPPATPSATPSATPPATSSVPPALPPVAATTPLETVTVSAVPVSSGGGGALDLLTLLLLSAALLGPTGRRMLARESVECCGSLHAVPAESATVVRSGVLHRVRQAGFRC